MSSLRQNLLLLMKRENYSTTELAKKTGIPQPTLHHILSGITLNPRKKVLQTLADFFSISIIQLIGTSDLNEDKNSNLIKIPIHSWEQIKNWPNIQLKDNLEKIYVDKKISVNSFAIILDDDCMFPMFPANSILVFDPNKKPNDRSYIIVHLFETDQIIFNRLIIDLDKYYIKSPKLEVNDEIKLICLKLTKDRIIGTLVESRTIFE